MKTEQNEPIHMASTATGNIGCVTGLTKREYFAALAMQGYISRVRVEDEVIAKFAVDLADELIKSLNKEQK